LIQVENLNPKERPVHARDRKSPLIGRHATILMKILKLILEMMLGV